MWAVAAVGGLTDGLAMVSQAAIVRNGALEHEQASRSVSTYAPKRRAGLSG